MWNVQKLFTFWFCVLFGTIAFDHKTLQWDFDGETEAYFLDKINLKLYRVSADGTVVLAQ